MSSRGGSRGDIYGSAPRSSGGYDGMYGNDNGSRGGSRGGYDDMYGREPPRSSGGFQDDGAAGSQGGPLPSESKGGGDNGDLELEHVIGYTGHYLNTLGYHPTQPNTMIYAYAHILPCMLSCLMPSYFFKFQDGRLRSYTRLI